MSYCTLADLQLAIPAQTLVWLSDDDPAAMGINLPVVVEAIRQAEELVEGYLRGRYNLPLDPVPSIIKDMAVNIARHWLYARRPEGNELPEAVTRTYNAAIKTLETIRDNRITLGLPTGASAPEPGEIKVRARPQRFGNCVLDKY